MVNLAGSILGAASITLAGGCSSQPEARAAIVIDSVEAAPILIKVSDIAAYRSGVSREIGLRSEAERLGFVAREEMVDSAAADAAGLPVAQYRLIAGAVEALLARGPKSGPGPEHQLTPDAVSEWSRQQFSLDSLRLEALVLRARTGI